MPIARPGAHNIDTLLVQGTSGRVGVFPVMESKAHDTPSDISAQDGEVMVDGPGGLAYSFTPEAAAETSERLLGGAAEAQGQKLLRKSREAEERDA